MLFILFTLTVWPSRLLPQSVLSDSVNLLFSQADSLDQPFEGCFSSLQDFCDLPEPDSSPVPLGQFLNPPEQSTPEECPFVLEEDSDELIEADSDAALHSHADVAGFT